MGLGADLLNIMRGTVRLTDSVERLNLANAKLQDKMDGISDRILKLETRLDTYAEIAQTNRIRHKAEG